MPDPQKPKFPKVATFALLILALVFAVVNAWPRPRGIYGTDYGWPLTLATAGSNSHFDVLALLVDLIVALDGLILVGAMLSPAIRKLALFWAPFILLQLVVAALIKLMFLFIIR